MYLVFICPRCGSIRYAKETQKKAQCFICRYKVPIDPKKIRILCKTEKSKDAVEAVQKLKMRRKKKIH